MKARARIRQKPVWICCHVAILYFLFVFAARACCLCVCRDERGIKHSCCVCVCVRKSGHRAGISSEVAVQHKCVESNSKQSPKALNIFCLA